MLIKVLKRAKELCQNGNKVFSTSNLKPFLKNNYTLSDFENNPYIFNCFSDLDDFDIMSSIKEWQNHSDTILSVLSNKIIKESY